MASYDRRKPFLERMFHNVPPHIRRRIKYDREAEWSVTNASIADHMTERILKFASPEDTITDFTACIGGNVMSFAKRFAHVNAIEFNDTRFSYLKHNVDLLGFKNVTTVHGNALDEVPKLRQRVLFCDLPWGGPEYWQKDRINLFLNGDNGPVNLIDICKKFKPHCQFMALKVPENFDLPKFIWETFDDFKIVDIETSYRKMNMIIIEVR
jgi:hypothetical protein